MRMMLAPLVAIFFLALFVFPACAEINWHNNCTDGKFWRNATLCIGTSCNELTQPPIECPDGCSENGLMCNSADNVPNDYIMLSAMAFIITSGLVFYLSYKIGNSDSTTKTSSYISFMFLALGIILILTAMGILGSFFTAQPDGLSQVVGTGYTAFIIVFILIMAIFFADYLFGYFKGRKFNKGYR